MEGHGDSAVVVVIQIKNCGQAEDIDPKCPQDTHGKSFNFTFRGVTAVKTAVHTCQN